MAMCISAANFMWQLIVALLAIIVVRPCVAAEEEFTVIVAGDHFEEPPAGMVENMISHQPAIVVSTGDLVFRSQEKDFGRLKRVFLDPLQAVGCEFYPCVGNHEFPIVPNWKKLWGEEKGQNYYSIDFKNTHFIFLDSNRAAVGDRKYEEGSEKYYMQRQGKPLDVESEQYKWLVRDLTGTDKKLVFVCFHHPVLSFGGHHGLPVLQRDLAPLFEEHGVTAVFNGHSHGYERFVPARADVNDEKVNMVADPAHGVPYIVTASGTFKGNLYDIDENPLHASHKRAANFVVLEIKGDIAYCKTIQPPDNTVIDMFTLEPRR